MISHDDDDDDDDDDDCCDTGTSTYTIQYVQQHQPQQPHGGSYQSIVPT